VSRKRAQKRREKERFKEHLEKKKGKGRRTYSIKER